MMKHRELIVPGLILLTSAALSIASFTHGQIWGDDFAAYLMQARSLLDGTPGEFIERNAFTVQTSSHPPGPVAYPWGYPAMLAPLLAMFGLKLLPLKLLNTLFYLLFLAALYLLARRRLPAGWALAVTAVFAFNPALIAAHDEILSDLPFLFFSTLAILLLEQPTNTARRALLVGAVIFLASTIRTTGVLLLVPLLVSQVIHFRARPPSESRLSLALPWLAFAALTGLQALLLPNGQDSYLEHFSMLDGPVLLRNALYYLRLPGDFVKGIPLGGAFLVLAAVFLLFKLLQVRREDLVILSYLAASLGLYLLWPENQGLRFIYPLLPLMLLLSADGLRRLLHRLPARARSWAGRGAALLCGTFLLLSLSVSVRNAALNLRQDRAINGPFDAVSRGMFEFIQGETPPDSVIVFFKPRAMRLLTDRDSFMTERCEDLARGDYVVIHEKQGSNAQIGDLEACPGVNYPVVFNNQRFTVYEVAR